MLRTPKSRIGLWLRKASAFLLAYCFFATSVWSETLPAGQRLARRSAHWVYSLAEVGLQPVYRAPRRPAYPSSAISSDTTPSPMLASHAALNAAGSAVMDAARAADDDDQHATNCTIHSSQPSSDGDDDHDGGGYWSYEQHNYRYDDDDRPQGPNPPIVASGTTIFGPQTYVRTKGASDDFTSTITASAWITQPFYLHIVNGDGTGNYRVSSATIAIDGVTLLGESTFNQQLATADCVIQLKSPSSTLQVDLDSKPGSFLTITGLGQNQDHTPPVLSITAPVTGSTVNTTMPHIALTYNDVKGTSEPAASGVNVASLKVLLDGVDETSLFTERPNDASADVPASLALSQGAHTITASIQDNAGNTATATSQFQVATQSTLALQIVQPAAGVFLNTLTVPVQLTFSDNIAINTSSLKVTVNGVDRSSAFSVTASGATGNVPGQAGANQIVASISDVSGKQVTASVAFNVDTVAPTLTIAHPAPGSTHGSSAVEFSVQYSDDQALDLTSLKIAVDGTAVPFTETATTATGTVTLADGNHTLTASIKDKAGNAATASSTFSVDTTAPNIHISQPAPGTIQNTASVQVQVQYGDNENINTGSFKLAIDGVDQTSFFTVTATGATASLAGPFAEGSHTITAQIADQTGNLGQTSSSFVVDTIKPVLTIVAPVGAINSTSPSALAQYSDSGTGIDTSSVHVFVDGSDVTAGFSVGNASVTGTLAGLNEGTHQFRVKVADRAGNVADQTVSFLVDITLPAISFATPANNAFLNTTQPAVTLNYSDSGAGINAGSIHVFLAVGSNPETEITSAFTIGGSQATGTLGSPTPLVPGTYHLRAQVADNAGNQSGATAAFQIDTTPPTYVIQLPAANSFLNTATPSLLVTYQDDSSGVDPTKFAIRIDGIDRTNRMMVTATAATGALQASDALVDGAHQVEVTVVDRAGNSAPVVPQSFLVDTTPPTISITSPANGLFTNINHAPIAISYTDSGSGIDVSKLKVLVDGVDQTAQFTVTATGATGSPVAALPDGVHTITATIQDLAGNPATATAAFTVDTVPPQITITQPANGLFTNASSLVVTGSVVDAAPVTVTVAGSAVPVQNGTFTSAGITLGTNATQSIAVVATDAAGNSSTVTLTINIDRTPPTITGVINPSPNGAGWNNTAVTVTFTCADSGSGVATCPSPVTVATEGANQAITGTAVDKAGNTAQATVTVNIDETPPVITATPAPAPNAAGWNTTDVTITYVCSDSLSGVVACPGVKTVSTEGKAEQISVTVSDQAGNTATATVSLNIEKTAPTITASVAPAPNAAGWNNSNVTVSFVCTPSASDIVSCQTPVSVSTEGKGQAVSGNVTDQAGKTNTATATVNIDKTAPQISASIAPPPNAAGWNNTNVVITYLCSDSLSGVALCPQPATVSSEGAAENIGAQATDVAGNTAAVSTTLNIDKTPPVVTAAAAPPANGAGWNNSNVTVTFSCTDNLSGVASCPTQQVVGTEGQNQNIAGQATDVAGNVGTGGVTLSIDKTPPTIVQLSTPDTVSQLHPGVITVTANDNFFVTQVTISVNGSALGTFTSAPYQATLQVPAGSNPGDTLTVTAQATDEAGNTQSATRTVRVAADGVIVGQVLSDVSSFPIQGANVQAISSTATSDQSDDHGRYSLQASDSHLFLSVTSATPATTTVEREVFVQQGVGTVPVDARLTPLAAAVAIGSAGGPLSAGNITITVPAGAVGDGTTFQLTPLSGQGLPGLLPLGWSPLAAFDFRASASTMNLAATIAQLPNTVTHLVTYNSALHAWTMVAANLQTSNGSVSVVLPSTGGYALVVPDVVVPPIPVPNPGSALTGIAMQLLDPAASSSGSLSPAILPPSGGTSTATLGVQTTSPVPSGTVIQANILETFSLTSGDKVSEESRSEDIVIYGALAPANATLGSQFPVSPSQKYTNAQLLTGKVHLDIFAGREGVRGQPGGSDPVTLTDGTSTLSVPGGALSQDTAINVQSIALEDFVPTSSNLSALQEALVDFSGETLNTAAQLSISSTGLNPADTYFLTQVQRIDGIPHIVLIALAQINGANLTSVASPGLPGITQGGEYIFYDVPAPVGYVQGVATSSAGAVQALVQTDSLPIVSITGANGQFLVPALAGTANLKATAPHTNLAGSATVQVTAGQTAQANIQLTGTVTSAVVAPADGTLGVPTSTTITITTTAPLNPQSIVQANLVLLQGTASSGTPVPVQPFVLSSSGTVLSFAPVSNLNPATQYTIQVSGLADTFGGAIVVPVSSFTTKAIAALTVNPNAITFSFPDANGNIQVSAPAGSLTPGSTVMIVDLGNGIVLSLTALNDGSVSGSFQGTINDVLQVTVTDPTGSTTTYNRSQFVSPDGRVAVGSAGGTVTGPGGVELDIPNGALDQAVVFQIQAFGPTQFADQPPLPGANFGGGLQITVDHIPTFKQEVKVSFPKPSDAPDGAFYYVYRRLQGPNGTFAYETIDHAFVQGTGANATVVTASPPFPGYSANYGNYNLSPAGAIVLGGALVTNLFLAWTFSPALPGIPLPGVVTGKVLRPRNLPLQPGQTQSQVVFDPVPGVAVVPVDTNGIPIFNLGLGTSQADGKYVFWAPFFHTGSTVALQACDTAPGGDGTCHNATAYEVTVVDTNTIDTAGPLLQFYRNVAFTNITLNPLPPVAPPPQLQLNLFTSDQNGVLSPARGPFLTGTTLVVQASTNSSGANPITITGATLQGVNYGIRVNPTDPTSMFLDPNIVLSQAGVYTVTATAVPALGGSAVTASLTFLVVKSGGSNNSVTPGKPPTVDESQLAPRNNATGVPTSVLPQVVFTEPVNNVHSNVSLLETDPSGTSDGAAVNINIAGVGVTFDNQGNVTNVALSSVGDTDNVTAITIQPLDTLKYSTWYKIKLTGGISDLNKDANGNPAPLFLQNAPRQYVFQTFGPTELATFDTFSSPRIVVMQNHAYVTNPTSVMSQIKEYDVSNPAQPQLNAAGGATTFLLGRAQDIGGLETVPGYSALLAVGTGAGALPLPSNIFFYDVSDPNNITRVGAMSVTSSADQVGSILRMAVKDTFAYTSTFQKGIQVVDIQAAINEYKQVFASNPTQFGAQISTDGQGFALDTVVNTIPVMTTAFGGPPVQATLYGIAAGDLPLNQQTQTVVVATGVESLVVVDPVGGSVLAQSTNITTSGGTVKQGFRVALGNLSVSCPTSVLTNPNNCNVAAVVGRDPGGQPVLAIVDLNNPSNPQPVGGLELTPNDIAFDVVMNGNLALVSMSTQTLIIDLSDPSRPAQLGSIDGIAGTLTLNGFLFGTAGGGVNGLHVATLGALAYITSFNPKFIEVSPSGELFTDVQINYAITPPVSDITTAEVHIDVQTGGRVATLPGPVASGTGTVKWPSGTIVAPGFNYLGTVHAQFNGGELPTIATKVPLLTFPVAVQSHDAMLRIQVALPDQQLFVDKNGNPIDKYTVKLYLNNNASGSPAFQVTSSDIANAYLNTDVWFNVNPDGTGGQIQDGSTEAGRAWVTRKIDTFTAAAGISNPVRMQAYEIGTILGNLSAVTVVIFSETQQKNVKLFNYTLTPDGNWAALIQDINDTVNPGTTCGSGATCGDAGLLYRIASAVESLVAQYGAAWARGFVDGWKFAYHNSLLLHPIDSIFGLLKGVVELAIAITKITVKLVTLAFSPAQWGSLWTQVTNAWRAGRNAAPYLLDLTPLLPSLAGYASGYVAGFALFMVLELLATGAVTEGIGAIADAVIDAVRVPTWIVQITADLADTFEVVLIAVNRFIFIANEEGEVAVVTETAFRTIFLETTDLTVEVLAVFRGYQFSSPMLEAFGEMFAHITNLTEDLLKPVFDTLLALPIMLERAGAEYFRLIPTLWNAEALSASATAEQLEVWVNTLHLGLGIKDLLEQITQPGEDESPLLKTWPIGALEAGFIAAQNTDPSEQVILNLALKYTSNTGNVLFTLKPQSQDTTYTNQTITETVRLLVDTTVNLPVFSSDPSPEGKNAVAGLAKLIQAECSLP